MCAELLSPSRVPNLTIYCQAILDPKTSRRIFELAKDQQDELEGSDDDEDDMQDEPQNLQPRTPVAFDEDDDAGFDDAEDAGDVEEIFVSRRSLCNTCTHLITMHSPRKLTRGTCRHWMPYFPLV